MEGFRFRAWGGGFKVGVGGAPGRAMHAQLMHADSFPGGRLSPNVMKRNGKLCHWSVS